MSYYSMGKVKHGKTLYRVVANYTDHDGKPKRKTKSVYGLQEAKAVDKQLAAEVAEAVAPAFMTVQQLYDEYIAAKAHEVRLSSLIKTKSILANHVLNTDLPKIKLNKLSKKDLQNWKNEISNKDIMTSTKNNAYRELNTLLNYAVKLDYISKNPLKDIGRFKDPYFVMPQDRINYYTIDEFNRYIKVAKDNRKYLVDYACYVFFYLLFYTGLRKGELNAMKWSDKEGDVLHVRRSISQKAGYIETPPKNKSSYRDIRLPRNAIKVIDEYRAILQKNVRFSEDMRLCGGAKPIPDTVLENHNTLYAQLAGVKHIKIHDFRHSHATLLINNGVNIMEVSRRLGHADVKMTWNTYAHLYPSAEDSALEALEKA